MCVVDEESTTSYVEIKLLSIKFLATAQQQSGNIILRYMSLFKSYFTICNTNDSEIRLDYQKREREDHFWFEFDWKRGLVTAIPI